MFLLGLQKVPVQIFIYMQPFFYNCYLLIIIIINMSLLVFQFLSLAYHKLTFIVLQDAHYSVQLKCEYENKWIDRCAHMTSTNLVQGTHVLVDIYMSLYCI